MTEQKHEIELWELADSDPEKFMKILGDYRQMEDRLRCRLVSHETNFNYVTAGPYVKHPMGDAVLFFDAGKSDDVRIEYHVSYEWAQKWGRSEQELIQTALKNTEKYEPSTFRNLDEVLASLAGKKLPENYQSELPMYLLSNEEQTYGAIAVMYPEMLKKIRNQVGMDYYILPTSVHEVTILPKYPFLDPAKIQETVQRDNRESIREEDVISDHLFEYTEAKGRLERCSITEKEQIRNGEAR